jgi:hypothetical protein
LALPNPEMGFDADEIDYKKIHSGCPRRRCRRSRYVSSAGRDRPNPRMNLYLIGVRCPRAYLFGSAELGPKTKRQLRG